MASWKIAFGLILGVILSSCATVNCNFTGDNNHVTIEQPKSVSTVPSITASGNTVPLLK